MSSAGELLDALTDAGRGELIGNGLVLRADVRAIPADLRDWHAAVETRST
jgi:hypothetical protein